MTTWVGDGGGQDLYVFIKFLTTTIAEHYCLLVSWVVVVVIIQFPNPSVSHTTPRETE